MPPRPVPRVSLTLYAARQLVDKSGRTSDANACFCVVQLLGESGKVLTTAHSSVVRDEVPKWNETIELVVGAKGGVACAVTVEVWHKSRAKDRFLGRVMLPTAHGAQRDRCTTRGWWPLGKRSSKSHVGDGRIELALDCTRLGRAARTRVVHDRCFARARATLALPLGGGATLPPASKERLLLAVDCAMRDSVSGQLSPCTVMLTDWRLLWLRRGSHGGPRPRRGEANADHAPLQLLRSLSVRELELAGAGAGSYLRQRLTIGLADFRALQLETATSEDTDAPDIAPASLAVLHAWLDYHVLNPQLLLAHFDLSIHGARAPRAAGEPQAVDRGTESERELDIMGASAHVAAQRDAALALDLERMGVAPTMSTSSPRGSARRSSTAHASVDPTGWCEPRLNRSFELCDSYPALVALPAAFMRDAEAVRRSGAHGLGVDTSFALLAEVTKFRSRARLPALVWRDARTG
jgi:hypothetical protein